MGTPPSGEPVQTAPGRKKPMSPAEGALVALFAGAAVLTIAVVALNLLGDDDTAVLPSPSPTTASDPSPTAIPVPPPPPPNDPDASPSVSVPVVASVGPEPSPVPGTDPWQLKADHFRDRIAEEFAYECPANGQADAVAIQPTPVWGIDIYTDDSFVCLAAVHAGRISFASGGTVIIEMLAGRDSYPSTERNGILTQAWPRPWYASYRFVP